jgi:pimeloyl-ACP methyl ester carboxylesterase
LVAALPKSDLLTPVAIDTPGAIAMEKLNRRSLLLGCGATLMCSRGSFASGTIDEQGYVPIGGMEQWIAIQGEDSTNPAILYLHGGPGEAQSPFLNSFAPWKHDFTVVNWDQRGAGKTFEKYGEATPDLTLHRLTEDSVEVTRYALNRLGKRKLILVGQSFGAMLGLMVVRRAPDLYYAFVGTGQFVNNQLTMEYRERWAREQAAATHDEAGLKALEDVQTLSVNDWKRIGASRKWMMSPPDLEYLELQRDFAGPPDHPKPEAQAWVKGYGFEANKVGNESIAFDAMKDVPSIPVPYILIQGREDHVTPFEPARAYWEKVRSRGKAFAAIDGGHYACFTDSNQFLAAMRQHVLPLVR